MLRLMPPAPPPQVLLDQMASMGTPPLQAMSVPEARAFIDSMGAFNGEVEDVAHVEDVSIPGPASTLPARLYPPAGTGPFPLLVYFHGGGWVIGGIQSHDGLCRSLANAAACAVLSIDYPPPPPAQCPAAARGPVSCDAS